MSKIGIGIIGAGNRGTQLLRRFMRNDDCEIAALCDVYKPYATRNSDGIKDDFLSAPVPKMGEDLPPFSVYTDFREMLKQTDLDAVVVATPDHWHAVQTVEAFRAGKDVFVEKPLTITIREGRRMVEVQKETGQLAGVCLNRRGSSIYHKCMEMVRSGKLGDIKAAYATRCSNMYPDGIGRQPTEEPPADLDWDMWQGPRPERPYQRNLAPYYFRWWSDYSSQMGNWGVHYMDVIRWMIGDVGPVAVTAVGTRMSVKDDGSIPDTMSVLFEMPSGAIVHFDINEASSGLSVPEGEVLLCGTKGTLAAGQDRYRVTPAQAGQFQSWDAPFEEDSYEIADGQTYGDLGIKEDSTQNLIDNFITCVQTREAPICSLEDGHRSTTFAHLANISLQLRQRIEWDTETEQITNIPGANEQLHYEYREPWSLD